MSQPSRIRYIGGVARLSNAHSTRYRPIGVVGVSSPYARDLSKLYATGKVTLSAVPEPTTLVTLLLGALLVLARRGVVVS